MKIKFDTNSDTVRYVSDEYMNSYLFKVIYVMGEPLFRQPLLHTHSRKLRFAAQIAITQRLPNYQPEFSFDFANNKTSCRVYFLEYDFFSEILS